MNRDTKLAWQTVRIYVQMKNDHRLPALDGLLISNRPARVGQSYAEQRSALSLLSQMYGGELVTLN